MQMALDMVDALESANLLVVPREPTTEMIEAGVTAGQLDRETVVRIYSAMVLASD